MEDELIRNDLVSVTTTASIISAMKFPSRPRKVIYIRNSGTLGELLTVHLGDVTSTVISTGITLKNGESYIEQTDAGLICYQGTISAISSAAGGVNVSIMERS